MKRESTLVHGKCDKTITSAMPLSHHLKSENSKHSSVTTGGLVGLVPYTKLQASPN